MRTKLAALPYNRNMIRNEVYKLKSKLRLTHVDNIDIVKFMELVLPKIDNDFYINIVPNSYFKDRYAEACPAEHVIRMPQYVYNKAKNGHPFYRLVLAHEIGHIIMHDDSKICYAYTKNKSCNIERQADIFSTEFLINYNFAKKHTPSEISETCGVPYKEACKYKKFITKENKLRKQYTKNRKKRAARSVGKRTDSR